jgi:hypothetical protein
MAVLIFCSIKNKLLRLGGQLDQIRGIDEAIRNRRYPQLAASAGREVASDGA